VRVRAALGRVRSPGGVPCLTVGDVGKAVEYYRTFYRFEPLAADVESALIGGHGTHLRLRLGARGWQGPRADGAPPPDAVVLVTQPRILRRRLDDWGAHIVPAQELGSGWDEFFGFRDCYGNVVAVGPTGGSGGLRRLIAEPLDDLRRQLDERATARAEAHHLAGFRDFYRRLPDRPSRYFLHFNGGLLHWVLKTAGYVPDEVDLVLLGSDLPPEERNWVAEHLRRPFHHVDLRLDDAGALEFLFAAADRNFGWLELGCLVLNHRLFAELTDIEPDTSVNCVWSWDSGFGFSVANSYLLFTNVDGIRRVRASGVDTGPGAYAYERLNRQVEGRRCYTHLPSRSLCRRLAEVVPLDAAGRPAVPGGMAVFESTVMYQLAARLCGLRVNPVRPLTGYNTLRGEAVQDDSSDEVLYVGGLGYADVLEEFSGYFHDSDVRLRYLMAEYLTLAPVAARLPESYRQRLAGVVAALADHGVAPNEVEELCRRHLVQARGLSGAAADAVVRPPAHRISAGRRP
jgi:hypothetical protein